jgi:hypothetical protein
VDIRTHTFHNNCWANARSVDSKAARVFALIAIFAALAVAFALYFVDHLYQHGIALQRGACVAPIVRMILAEAYSPRRIADLLIWISFGSPGSLFAMQKRAELVVPPLVRTDDVIELDNMGCGISPGVL